eukprot:12588276-Heterocapsa_arctica.AAC.1
MPSASWPSSARARAMTRASARESARTAARATTTRPTRVAGEATPGPRATAGEVHRRPVSGAKGTGECKYQRSSRPCRIQ